MALKTDAVFEGGGVKGIGLAGAVAAIENAGYEFQNLAGTSAGAIVAALLAVGCKAARLKEIIESLDYRRFQDKGALDRFGLPGIIASISFEYGIYEGKFFESWLEGLLKDSGKTTFGDILTGDDDPRYRYKLQIIASDISDRKLLVLPQALAQFGFDPDRFPIARAVRMSMSIPLFFEPVKLVDAQGRTHYIVDGGILSNYPVWLLDDGTSCPSWPTFGFKLVEPAEQKLKEGSPIPIRNVVDFLASLFGTMMGAHDNYHISTSKGDFDRTISISTVIELAGAKKEIKTTDFGITRAESDRLYQNGFDAATAFLSRWNFEDWKLRYRQARTGLLPGSPSA
jgi:NTE family protein